MFSGVLPVTRQGDCGKMRVQPPDAMTQSRLQERDMASADLDSRPLSPQDRQQLEAWLADFDRTWNERRLAARMQELPPASNPLRLRLLLGMVRIDLRRRWLLGQKVTVETYLKVCPELGTPDTVPLSLVYAEFEIRAQSGTAPDL